MNGDPEEETTMKRFASFSGVALIISGLIASAVGPTIAGESLEPIVIGQPQRIEVFPPAIKLQGKRRHMQMVVTGHYADGTLQDLTRAAQFTLSNPTSGRVEGSVVYPQADGAGEIIVDVAGQQVKVPLEVSGQTV